jgi:hypothetical protein
LLIVAAAPAPTASKAPPVVPALSGNWGGDGFALRPAQTGYVVQGKCAAGKINDRIVPDASGAFVAKGYFNAYTSGYRLSDIAPRDHAATFKGQVSGDRLTLTMRVAGRPDEMHYVLKRGAIVKFPKCDV